MKKWIPSNGFLLNLILFFGVVLVLIAIHFILPTSVHEALVFDHSEFDIYTLWTAAYIHVDNGHLFRNLFGYVASTFATGAIFFYRYRHWVLRRIFLVYLVVFPILINLTSYAVFWYGFEAFGGESRGFSGIVGALFGLLLISVIRLTYDRLGWRSAYGVAGTIIFVVILRMLVRAGAGTPKNIGLCVLGAIASLYLVIRLDYVRHPKSVLNLDERARLEAVLVAGSAVIITYVLPGMFPLNWVQDDHIVNIFAHFAGFVLGIISGILVFWYLKSRPQSHAQWPESSMK